MHFRHPISITAFKKYEIFSKFVFFFQAFSYAKVSHFGIIFGLNISKTLAKNAEEVVKSEKKSEI